MLLLAFEECFHFSNILAYLLRKYFTTCFFKQNNLKKFFIWAQIKFGKLYIRKKKNQQPPPNKPKQKLVSAVLFLI